MEQLNLRPRISRWFCAKDFYECMKPLIRLSYWHGLTPFYIASDKQGKDCFKHSAFGYLNAAVHVLIYTICYIFMLANQYESVAGYFFRSSITRFGDFMQILSGFIGVTVIYITAIVPKHRLQRSLESVHTSDELLQGIGIKIMYTKSLRLSYFNMSAMFSVNLVYIGATFWLLNWSQEVHSTALYITFVLQHTVIYMVVSLFLCYTGTIRMRFVMVNKELFTPSDAYSAEKTLLWVTFIFGLTPFRLRGIPGERTLSISPIGFLNTIVHLCFFMFCFIYSLAHGESIVGLFFQSEISKIGDMIQKFIGMAGLLILFGISLCNYQDIMFLCESIYAVDQRFLTIGVVFKYCYIMRLTHSKIFLVIGVNCIYMGGSLWLLFRNNVWPSYQAIISFFMPHVFLLMAVVLFTALVLRLQQHFDLINKVGD